MVNGKTKEMDAMKRNKRTTQVVQKPLAPLTEKILAGMGPEGAEIHQRLLHYVRQRTDQETRGQESDELK